MTTTFQPIDDSDVINKSCLVEKLKKKGNISYFEKGYNESK